MSQGEHNGDQVLIRTLAWLIRLRRASFVTVIVFAPVFVFPALAYTFGARVYRALLPGATVPEIATMALGIGDFLSGNWLWVVGAVVAVLAVPTIAVRVVRHGLPVERRDAALAAVWRQAGGSALEVLLQPISFRLLMWYVVLVLFGGRILSALSRPPFVW